MQQSLLLLTGDVFQ